MKLMLKFNLILVVLLGAGIAVVALLARDFLMQNARDQVMEQAELMVQDALAIRDYTAQQVTPLLEKTPMATNRFLPQAVPFYAATETFELVRKQYPDYVYKEASLNPTNPRDRATDWESDVIYYFRNFPGKTELVRERDTPTGRVLYIAHPVRAEKPCLLCHSDPSKAPPAVVKTYGRDHGFGWKLNGVVAAQLVSVPTSVPVQIGQRAFQRLLIYLISIFVATIAVLDTMLHFLVIRPVGRLAELADCISKGDLEAQELPVRGRDEIAVATASFNRMYTSLVTAIRMLKNP